MNMAKNEYIGTSPELPARMNALEPLVETPAFSVAHDAALRCLYVAWRGHHAPADTVAHYLQVLHHVRRTRACRLLNDSSECLDGWGLVARWVGGDYFAALADEGVGAIAWVKSRDWPARAAIDRAMQFAVRPLVDTFAHTSEAYAWLRAVP